MRKNRVTLPCLHCGTLTEVIKAREEKFKYCSQRCHGFAVLAKIDPKEIPRARGANHFAWKGGRRKHTNGYIWILVDGKYWLEHRWVMMQHLGRTISRSEHVHHLNGNKLDNRIENLELLSVAEHTRQHNPRLGTGKPILFSSLNCEVQFTSRHQSEGPKFCSSACFGRYQKGKPKRKASDG